MRTVLLASVVSAVVASCVPAGTGPRYGAPPAATSGDVIAVSGGRFETAVTYSELTYVVDTRRSLCFATADRIRGTELGTVGMTPVDCCALRGSLPETARAWAQSLRCVEPIAPPPAAAPAP